MNAYLMGPTLAVVAGGIDEGRSSPNNAAGIAGFAFLLLWIIIVVVQVLRHRRRQVAVDAAATSEATALSETDDEDGPRAADDS